MIDIMKIQNSVLSSISPHLTSLNSNINGVKTIETFEESFDEHRLSYAFVEQNPANSSVR